MKGLLAILACYLLGECVCILTGGYLPGSVSGMALLFTALATGILKKRDVAPVAGFLLRNMLLFFVPVCAGIIVSYRLLAANIIPVLVIIAISTVAVMGVAGLVVQHWSKRR